jgi:hypothetical protein
MALVAWVWRMGLAVAVALVLLGLASRGAAETRGVRQGAAVWLSVPSLAATGPPADCAAETLPIARAACLDLAADTLAHAMEVALDRFAAGLAGSAPFAADLGRAQDAWARMVAAACTQADTVARAACRLVAAQERSTRVTETLERARNRLGQADPMALGDVVLLLHPARTAGRHWTPR